MSPPPAGSGDGRTLLGRLGDALRRRPRPGRSAPPATVPGLGSGEETAVAAAAKDDVPDAPGDEIAAHAERAVTADEPVPQSAVLSPEPPAEPAARIDEARDRLRARIDPPPPDDVDDVDDPA